MTFLGVKMANPSEFPEGFDVDQVMLDLTGLTWRWGEHTGVCWPPQKGLEFFILWPPGHIPNNRDAEELIESLIRRPRCA